SLPAGPLYPADASNLHGQNQSLVSLLAVAPSDGNNRAEQYCESPLLPPLFSAIMAAEKRTDADYSVACHGRQRAKAGHPSWKSGRVAVGVLPTATGPVFYCP